MKHYSIIPQKKILLTGGIDKEKLAIAAFNKGIIHRFINKADANFPEQLKFAISALKEAYFRDLTNKIVPELPNSTDYVLHHNAYINFVKNLQLQVGAAEYYLIDTSGSCLFLNSDGAETWLIIKNQSEIAAYEQIARDQEATASMVDALMERKKIPFFFTNEDFEQPVHCWEKYLHTAHPLPGMPAYYYAIEYGNIRDSIHPDKLIAWEKFRSSI